MNIILAVTAGLVSSAIAYIPFKLNKEANPKLIIVVLSFVIASVGVYHLTLGGLEHFYIGIASIFFILILPSLIYIYSSALGKGENMDTGIKILVSAFPLMFIWYVIYSHLLN